MLYLILSILCSAALSVVMRLSEGKVTYKLPMLATNYVICFMMSWGLGGFPTLIPNVDGIQRTFAMGVFNGCFYMLALVVGQYCISKSGVILSSVFSKIGGLVIPLIVSTLVFSEIPTVYQFIGFILSLFAIVALNYRKENESSVTIQWSLLALFLTEGCAGIMAKVFREEGRLELEYHFLLYTFLIAFLLCGIRILIKKERFGLQEVLYGIAIGVPNFLASRFLLKALVYIPAVVAYPVRSVATIGVIAVAGLTFFHERLRKLQWIAMGVIVVALILLSV